MVGVAGYPAPFHVIEIGVGHHRPGGGDPADPVRARRPGRPRLPGRPRRRPQRGRGAGRPRRRAARASSTSRGPLERPIGPAQVALAEMLGHAMPAALRSARLDDERRERLHAIERVLEVSRGARRRPRPAAGSSRPSSTPSPSCWPPTSSPCSRAARTALPARGGRRFPRGASGSRSRLARHESAARSSSENGSTDRSEVAAWPADYRDDRPGGAIGPRPRWPCRSRSTTRSPRSCSSARPSAPTDVQRDSSAASPTCSDPGRDRAPERRPAMPGSRECGGARPADRAAQSALLRRGGRDRDRQRPARRARH